MKSTSDFDRNLGKLICEKAGLEPSEFLEDWDVKEASEGRVMVTLRRPVFLTKGEFEALQADATRPGIGG